MSKSLVKRFWDIIGYAVINFIIVCILYKFFLRLEDWLSTSIMWTIYWSFGRLVAQLTSSLHLNKKQIALLYVLMVSIALIRGVVVLKLLLKIPEWTKLFIITTVPFILGFSFTMVSYKKN